MLHASNGCGAWCHRGWGRKEMVALSFFAKASRTKSRYGGREAEIEFGHPGKDWDHPLP